MRPPPFFTRARDIIWGRIRRRVGFNLRAFHLTIPLSLTSLSLYIPLFPSLYPFIPLSPSLPPSLSLSLSLLSLPPSLYLSFYLSLTLFPSLSLLFIILFGVSNGRFRPCSLILAEIIYFSRPKVDDKITALKNKTYFRNIHMYTKSFSSNISHQLFDLTITFVNSQL